MKEQTTGEAALSVSRASCGRTAYGAELALADCVLRAAGNPPVQFVLPNGQAFAPAGPAPVAKLRIRDHATLVRLLLNPSVSFGDGYASGRVEVEGDLVEFLEALYRAHPEGNGRRTLPLVSKLWSNTCTRACRNARHHYDVGNDFYRLWLDREMVYTCAYYPSADLTLEEAQAAKMDYVGRKLRLRAGERVVEAGCGWGALALHLARHFGVKVRACNVSCEQIAFARERARHEGLDRAVEFVEDDYRNLGGTCDAFVSVGMLEHVGRDHYRDLGEVIDRCLTRTGRGLVHTIGRDQPAPLDPWIRQRIFPGAYTPTLREMMDVLEPWGFSVLDVENLRLHYADTLREWLARFEAAFDRVVASHGEDFARAWRLYLAGSVAAFTTGTLQLFQVVFSRPGVNDLPRSRSYLYAGEGPGGTV